MMRVFHLVFCLLVMCGLAGCGTLPLLSNGGHFISTTDKKVQSWDELNKKNIVMQQFDYSCGAASLATVMRYYFDDDVTEKSLMDDINSIFSDKEMKVIEETGLSFLELEKIAQHKHYQTASVRLAVSALKKLEGPVLIFVEPNGYKHFAILRGVVEDRVFLADPSRGNIRMSIHEFLEEWSGYTFVLGKEGFGLPQSHNLAINHQKDFRHELSLLRAPWRVQPHLKRGLP